MKLVNLIQLASVTLPGILAADPEPFLTLQSVISKDVKDAVFHGQRSPDGVFENIRPASVLGCLTDTVGIMSNCDGRPTFQSLAKITFAEPTKVDRHFDITWSSVNKSVSYSSLSMLDSEMTT
jgi:hypothetical protein